MNQSMMNVNVNLPPGYIQQQLASDIQKNSLPPMALLMSPQISALQSRQQAQQVKHQVQHQVQQHLYNQAPVIRDVWSNNVEQEMAMIRCLVESYNYVSIATEFPGIIARPLGSFRSTPDYHYQTMRSNADILKLIQLSLSLTDSKGNRPEGVPSIWQFNFKFDLESDMFSADNIEGLINQGVNFARHKQAGIDPFEFSQLLTDSGLCLVDDVYWISYHAGYDFGFLIAMLTNNIIPQEESEFFWWINKYFPNLYDVKYLSSFVRAHSGQNSQSLQPVKSSLESLSDELGVPRLQNVLSCGYATYLINGCFKELQRGLPEITNYKGFIWGLGSASAKSEHVNSDELPNGLQSPRGIVHYGRPM